MVKDGGNLTCCDLVRSHSRAELVIEPTKVDRLPANLIFNSEIKNLYTNIKFLSVSTKLFCEN